MALWRAKDKPPVELVVANLVDLVTVIIRRMKHGIIQKENREKNI